MKTFAIVLSVVFALASAFGVITLIHGFSNGTDYAFEVAEGSAVLSFAPVAMLLCFAVILLADIRAALVPSTKERNNYRELHPDATTTHTEISDEGEKVVCKNPVVRVVEWDK